MKSGATDFDGMNILLAVALGPIALFCFTHLAAATVPFLVW